jgi:hypothetical protein
MMRQLLLFIFISLAFSLSAEQFKITGKVVDARDSLQCIGASVMVVGTNRGTATDGDGNFSIDVEKGAILKFSYLGYYDKLVEVLNDSSLVVEMKEWKEFCYCSEYSRHIILPDNHLKRSLKEIKSLYPHLKKCKGNIYESKHGNEVFSLYNGIVYKQSYSFKHYTLNLPGNSNALERVYYSFVNSFKGYDSSEECQSGKGKIFYYPEYSIHIQYEPKKCVSVTYELNPEYYK